MEKISTLREICQKPREKADTAYGRHCVRFFSIYVTRIFLILKFTPNFVTLLSLATGFAACVLFYFGTPLHTFLGTILLQIWYLLDHVDGEIARYNKTTSLAGIYFDTITHYIIHPLALCSLGLGYFNRTGYFAYAVLGCISGFSIVLINVTTNIKDLVILNSLAGLNIKHKLENQYKPDNRNIIKKIFMLVHSSCTYPNVMNIITLFSIIDMFLWENYMFLLLWYYSISATLVWLARFSVFIKDREIDLTVKALAKN